MTFTYEKSIELLKRTPVVLSVMLRDLPREWTTNNEGPDTWSPYDVLGHLIHGEVTDWITRLDIILSDGEEKTFTPFDRFAQFRESKGKTLHDLLEEFAAVRESNIQKLQSRNLDESDLDRTGIHPTFGTVTLRNLLATWVVHDLDHISQIVRVMAYQYRTEVGPWTQYLRILNTVKS